MINDAIRKIKSRLPKGYREAIQKATGLSIGYIDKVFNCTRKNQRVVDAGLAILEAEADANQVTLDRLNRIIKHES